MARLFLARVLVSSLVLAGLARSQSSPTVEPGTAVEGSPGNCGDIYCADSSRAFRPESPLVPPKVNHVFRDPEFASRIIRVTSEAGIDGNQQGFSFGTNSSAEINEWGKFNPALGPDGGYYFYVHDNGGGVSLFSMDARTMQVTPHCNGLPRCRIRGGSFSYSDPNVVYGHFDSNSTINAYNISTGKMTTLYDLTKCPNLPAELSGYPGALSNSGDDTKFTGYSGGKMQGWGSLVTYYDRTTNHCYWYDTATGTVGGSGMTPTPIKAGMVMPPAPPRLSATSGNLHPGDYYVQLTANTLRHPELGETLASAEAHIHLDSTGGIAISAPEIDNPDNLVVAGYNVYIGAAPGQEARQASVKDPHAGYTQSAPLAQGPRPPRTSTAGYDIHNVRLSRDGKYVRVMPQIGLSMIIWNVGTSDISACSIHGEGHSPEVASFCGGHAVMGYTHLINAGGANQGNATLLIRPFADLKQYRQLLPRDVTVPASMDVHWSWNNADPDDSTPVCGSYSRSSSKLQGDGTLSPATNPVLGEHQAWDREIVCVATSGRPRVWRFAHHRATGACNASSKDGSCFGSIAIGNVSQDGKFFLFSSDWNWMLGSDRSSPGCPAAGRCRTDVFIVELK